MPEMEPMQLTHDDAGTNTNNQQSSGSGRLAGKIAVITGASSGIGRAISLRYAREGAKLVVSDINQKTRNEEEKDGDLTTVQLVEKLGGTAIFVECNTTDEKAVDNLVKTTVEKFGRLDIMVNNAGIATEAADPRPIWEFDTEGFKKTYDVNVNGVAYGCRAAAKQMMNQEENANGDRGHIINLASVYGILVGVETDKSSKSVAYSSSKHAVVGITRVAALDLAPYNVHVNMICPGFTNTAFIAPVMHGDQTAKEAVNAAHPMRGIGIPDDLARIAVVLASDDARWMTGSPVFVDGGYTVQ